MLIKHQCLDQQLFISLSGMHSDQCISFWKYRLDFEQKLYSTFFNSIVFLCDFFHIVKNYI